MRPEKLVMENFGPYSGRVELDFSKLEDIFLVTGKTGAGKTTIFDAICFALYGKVPGSRGNHPGKLHSDHAAEGTMSFVSFEFSIGEAPCDKSDDKSGENSSSRQKRYLVERTPKQERKKKRGEGTIVLDETLAVYQISAGAKTEAHKSALVSKKSEGDAKIKSLIGLDAEEFFKVVLLPQGEFAEFLKQNTSDRQKVLGKLFPVDNAMRVKEIARKKTTALESQLAEAAARLSGIAAHVNADNYQNIRADAVTAVEKAGEESTNLEKEEALLRQLIRLRQSEEDAQTRLAESARLFEQLQVEKISIGEKSNILSRSRAARPLEQYVRGAESSRIAASAAEAELVKAEEEKTAAEKSAAEAEHFHAQMPELETEINQFREKRPGLSQMLEEEEKIFLAENELGKHQEHSQKLKSKYEYLSDELKKQDIYIEENENLAGELQMLEQKYEISRLINDTFKQLRKYRDRFGELEKERTLAADEIRDLEQQAANYEKQIPVQEAELKKLKTEKAESLQVDMAANLSVLLEDGKPCPVCGSKEHPNPAKEAESPFDFNQRIEVQEALLKDAEKNRAATFEKLEAKKRELKKSGDNFALLENEIKETRQSAASLSARKDIKPFLEISAPLPSKEIIGKIIETESNELNTIIVRKKNAREADVKKNELYQHKTAMLAEQSEVEKNMAVIDAEEKNLTQKITESREKRRALLEADAFHGLAFEDAKTALESLDTAIAEKESNIVHLRKEREHALLKLAAAEAAVTAAESKQNEMQERKKEADAAILAALAGTDFSSSGEAENALLDLSIEDELEKAIAQWRENRTSLTAQIAEQEKQLKAIRRELELLALAAAPALKQAHAELENLALKRAEAEEEKTRALAALNNLEKDMETLQEAQKRHDDLFAQARRYRSLFDDLSGKNPRKLPFDSWLLANYLEEAAAYATKRLEKMSDYRYSLLLDSHQQQGRGYSGLELAVFDAHTGKTRPCATLSGGESFMASISLALGLADSIQNRSGGVRLDTIFIDEGFGSLDDATLDKALVILDELRDSRMVGLISHVGEMRLRIPCRVEVVKTAYGSRIETQ